MKPVLQALVLAERVFTDGTSGMKIIAGTFNRLWIGSSRVKEVEGPGGAKRQVIPGGTDMGCPWAYVSLTDVVDGTEIDLEMVNISRNEVLFRTSLSVQPKDRLATVEIVAPLPPLRSFVTQAGTYAFDVVWRGDVLGSHRLIVEEVAPRPGQDPSESEQGG